MRRNILYILLMISAVVYGQEERKYIREGYKAYMDEKFDEAEIGFRKAEETNDESYIARYNTSAALYQQQKLEESGKRFQELMAEAPDKSEEAKLLHNMGNVLLESQKYQEAADAYKRSLRINPVDEDTRYNLAYALEKLREQQQQQQQQQQQDNKNQDKNDNKQNDQQQEQQDQDKQEEQENQEQQQQQQDQQKQEQEEQEKQQQQQKQEMNEEEAERLLNAILQKEKDVKEKVDKKKAAAVKVKTDKDW